jgi:GH24 family phage-related lysozyme (muramidase)
MKTSEQGIAIIRRFEGCSLVAYQDPVGVWTIGYGWTQPVDGEPIAANMQVTRAKALNLLAEHLQQYEQAVSRLVTVPLNQNQFDALVDFTYNLGGDALAGSMLLKKLNNGDINGAAGEFMQWVRAGGEILPGLVKRRKAERALFLT